MAGTWWVEEVNGKGVVVGPSVDAPTGVTLFSPIGYPTKALAEAAAKKVSSLPTKVANAVSSAVTGNLGNQNLWIRGGEILAGALILYVGIKAVATPGGASVATQNVKSTGANILRKAPTKPTRKAPVKKIAKTAVKAAAA
jgi:hypothetical protein